MKFSLTVKNIMLHMVKATIPQADSSGLHLVHTQNCDEWPLLHSIYNNHLHKVTLHLPPADNWGIAWSLWN